jgi:hypothetical protein
LYEGQFIMALSTTQSIWRSGGGDQTRTAYCGSGQMVAQFYIADGSESGNVKISSANGAPALILPLGAVVLSVVITNTGTGTIDLGTVGYTSGTADANGIADGITTSAVATVNVGAVVTGTALPEMSYVTHADNTGGGGTIGGYISYFVVDPLAGQQSV